MAKRKIFINIILILIVSVNTILAQSNDANFDFKKEPDLSINAVISSTGELAPEFRKINIELEAQKKLSKDEKNKSEEILNKISDELKGIAFKYTAIPSTSSFFNNLLGRVYIGLGSINTDKRLEFYEKSVDPLLAAATINGSAMNFRNLGIAYYLIGDEYKNDFWNEMKSKDKNILKAWEDVTKANQNFESAVAALSQSQNSRDYLNYADKISTDYSYANNDKNNFQENLTVHWFSSKSMSDINTFLKNED
jgi:hypothetical protein